ncbi:MAG: hypothetical protein QXY05_00285 [Candidatus Anstonellales archaeon]
MKKGFFFVLGIFILLVYVAMSLQAYTRAIDESGKGYEETIKIATYDIVLAQLSNETMNEIVDIYSYYAIYKMINHTAEEPIKAGEKDELEHFREVFRELVQSGESKRGHFAGSALLYDEEEKGDYTFDGLGAKLKESLEKTGMKLEAFNVSYVNISQTEYNKLNVEAVILLNISGKGARLDKVYRIHRTLEIEGMDDPMVLRWLRKHGFDNASRQIWFAPYPPQNPKILTYATHGQGWFYGPLVSARKANKTEEVNETERWKYIVVGDYSDFELLEDQGILDEFGGYVLTNSIDTQASGDCPGKYNEMYVFNAVLYDHKGGCKAKINSNYIKTDKPFAVAPDFYIEMADTDGDGKYAVLFVNQHTPEEVEESGGEGKVNEHGKGLVYDIEMLRDEVICGYYFPAYEAPSFLQRFLENAENRTSEYGIEGFVVGEVYGGELYSKARNWSRIDWEFIKEMEGIKVRGMPGCKSFEMCSGHTPIGNFALTEESLGEYNMDEIACNDGRAGCEKELGAGG